MRKRLRILFIVLISLLVLMGIFLTVFFTSPKFYYLYEDGSQLQNVSFNMFCMKHNYRLIRVELSNEILLDKNELEKRIKEVSQKGSAVLMSPLVSFCVSEIGFQTQDDEAVFIAMGSKKEKPSFDFYLTYSAADGWGSARRFIEGKDYNPLFIYNESTQKQKDAFESELKGEIPSLKLESFGNRFISQVKLQITEQKYDLIICPYLEDVSEFFEGNQKVFWIVDGLLKNAINEKYLLAFLDFDFQASLEPIVSNLKHVKGVEIPLNRVLKIVK